MIEYMDDVERFFREVSTACLQHVAGSAKSVKVTASKQVAGDIATDVDVSTEELIVREIKARFPDDDILAEEGFSDTAVGDERLWVIDPICGTTNISRGINMYCTNIALVDAGEIIAACVIDYSLGELIWSVGDGVFVDVTQVELPTEAKSTAIDVDTGCIFKISTEEQQEYSRILSQLLQKQEFMIASMSTSLSAAYVATGKMDANIRYHYGPWDVCSAVFLTRQIGGVATDFEGNEWQVASKRLVLSRNSEVHEQVLQSIASAIQ